MGLRCMSPESKSKERWKDEKGTLGRTGTGKINVLDGESREMVLRWQ